MVASRKVEIAFYRGNGRHRGRGYGALTQVSGRTANSVLRKKIVPPVKRVGADLLEFAVPEIAEVVTGRKNFKTAAKSVGRQTLRKQLGEGSHRQIRGRKQKKIIPSKTTKQSSQSRRNIFTNISR